MSKFNTYTDLMLCWAINDCHATLEAGQYAPDHPYGRKVWAEIDAIRAVQMTRDRIRKEVERKIMAKAITA
jgi:hypothetical protein